MRNSEPDDRFNDSCTRGDCQLRGCINPNNCLDGTHQYSLTYPSRGYCIDGPAKHKNVVLQNGGIVNVTAYPDRTDLDFTESYWLHQYRPVEFVYDKAIYENKPMTASFGYWQCAYVGTVENVSLTLRGRLLGLVE